MGGVRLPILPVRDNLGYDMLAGPLGLYYRLLVQKNN